MTTLILLGVLWIVVIVLVVIALNYVLPDDENDDWFWNE